MLSWLRVAVVLFTATVLQIGLLSDLRIAGVSADLLLALTVAAGLTGGPNSGAAVGFTAGLIFDLFLTTPLGLSAFAYCLTGYLVGLVENALVRTAWWISILFTIGGVAFGTTLYVMLGELLGQAQLFTEDFPKVLIIVSLYSAVFAPLCVWAMGWALGKSKSPRPTKLRVVMN
jgi:rod shape-determining protein MreD